MDKRTEFREMNTRKLEVYADMAGMTVYRDERNRVTDISYLDYSFGDPDEAWREREELFRPDPDEERLPDKTCDRYFIDYWKIMGGPYRHDGTYYKPKVIKWLETRAGRRAETARLKKEEAEKDKQRKEKERRQACGKRDREKREKRNEFAKAKARERAEEWKRQYSNFSPPPRPTPTEQEVIDRQYRQNIARRLRQKEAMDAGVEFSTQQQGHSGVITWSDPHITDVRLVRLVLSADRWSREMTAEEESDYWYWKARGK